MYQIVWYCFSINGSFTGTGTIYKGSVLVSEVVTSNSCEHDLPCLVHCRGTKTSNSHVHPKHIMQSKPISEYSPITCSNKWDNRCMVVYLGIFVHGLWDTVWWISLVLICNTGNYVWMFLRLAKVTAMLFICRAGIAFHYQHLKIAHINFPVIWIKNKTPCKAIIGWSCLYCWSCCRFVSCAQWSECECSLIPS